MSAPVPPAAPRMERCGAAWVASSASVLGEVLLGAEASVWFGATIRGDDAPITVGARTNVQDGAVLHADPGRPHGIEDEVTIGHGAICHGVRIGRHALVGMGAILLGGSVVGEGAVVGAGCVVKEGMEVPPFALVVGVPGRVVRRLDPVPRREEAIRLAADYVARAREHEAGRWALPRPAGPDLTSTSR